MTYVEPASLTHGKFSYDPECDALFVRIPGTYKVSVCQKNFTIDLDASGNIIAVEILDASKILHIAPEILEHHERWECRVIAQEKTIAVEFTFVSRAGIEMNIALRDRAKREYPATHLAVSP